MKTRINLALILSSLISIVCVSPAVFLIVHERSRLNSPWLILLAVIVAFLIWGVVSTILARNLTKSIIKPIEELSKNIDNVSTIPVYKELKPFVNTINKQHEDILSNADMRQEFTANVSHELKTPLTAISGYAEILAEGKCTSDENIHFASQIKQNSDRLMSLINDIIKLSELDGSQIQYKFENFDLFELAKTVVSDISINAKKDDINIECEGISSIICADKKMIEEVIVNLCDNSIRYNCKGGSVKVSVVNDQDGVILCVQDTGIGISNEDKERIFERFYRVDKSRSKQTGGTGLGLAIVKHIVMTHDAKLELESKLGVGTKIIITFPN